MEQKEVDNPSLSELKREDRSLKKLVPLLIDTMENLIVFNQHTLKQTLLDRHGVVATRRVFDILPVLVGTGFVDPHTQINKTYVYVGSPGVELRLKKFKSNPNVVCPFLESKQLRSVGWECMRTLAVKNDLTFDDLTRISGVRRRYDVQAVLAGARIYTVSNPRKLKVEIPSLKEKKKKRKEIRVSNDEIVDIFGPDAAIHFVEDNKPVFTF